MQTSHLRSLSPLKANLVPVPPKAPQPQTESEVFDSAELREGREDGGRRLARIGFGALGLLGAAGAASPALAQETVQTVQVQTQHLESAQDSGEVIRLSQQFRHNLSETTTPAPAVWNFSAAQQNDSLPSALEWIPASPQHRMPGSQQFDDDGWTAEVRIEGTRTQGNTQWTGGLRYSMLTQRGAWEPSPEYRGLRTDLSEVLLQRNQRLELSHDSRLFYGVGGGVQAIGDLGGRNVQENFHKYGGFGGRTGEALQGTDAISGSTLHPVITGGVGYERDLTSGQELQLRSSLTSSLALGNGLSTVQGQLGINFQPHPRFNFEAGTTLTAVHSDHPAMDFLPTSGVRPGLYAESSAQVTEHLRLFGRVQTGGVQNEPVYSVGFSVGLPEGRAWLRPFFD